MRFLTTVLSVVLMLALMGPVMAWAEEESEDSLHVGGALRFNLYQKSWGGNDANHRKGADFDFDVFRINVDAEISKVKLSGEYRFYAGYTMLHHGYVGYAPTNWFEGQIGVMQVPFGITPYASHNWFFVLPYYVGLEDDYDAGLNTLWNVGNFEAQLAFFKNDEGNYTGNSIDSARYSYDVVKVPTTDDQGNTIDYYGDNEETNQVNLRLAYTFPITNIGDVEIGASGQYGQIYNSAMDASDEDETGMGTHFAAAGHLVANFWGLNIQTEYITYNYSPENPDDPAITDDDDRDTYMWMGAYDFPYKVASEASIIVANVAYTFNLGWGPLDSVTVYNDYSQMTKSYEDFEPSMMDTAGFMLAAGPVYTYFDAAMGYNHPWLGPMWTDALAAGNEDAEWNVRYNMNMGYYF